MIKVERATKPAILKKNEEKWTTDIVNASDEHTKKKAIAKYNKGTIKKALVSMFHGKCAYCESYISDVDYGDIEHFRPKSKFPELAVTWDNLLLACKRCNGAEQKGDTWYDNNEGGPLVNPCTDEPDDFFEFEYDEETHIAIVKPKNKRGEISEEVYGLNKDELLRSRNHYIRTLVVLSQLYNSDEEAKTLLDIAIESKSEYAAFARMIKRKYT